MTNLRIVTVMFLWAICFPLITLGLPLAPHLTFATLRAVIAGAVLVCFALYLRRPIPRTWSTWRDLIVVGTGATTFGFLGMFHAAEFVSPGLATVVANIQPLFAAFLAHQILGERLNLRGKIGIALGFAGILVIAAPQLSGGGAGNNHLLGVAYIILAALGITVSNVMIKKISSQVDAFTAMGWQLILGAVPLGILSVLTENPTEITWSTDFLVSLLVLAIFGTAFVYWLWYRVLQEIPLTQANVFTFLVPLFGLAMGISFYNETFTVAATIGAGMALLGIWIVNKTVQQDSEQPG